MSKGGYEITENPDDDENSDNDGDSDKDEETSNPFPYNRDTPRPSGESIGMKTFKNGDGQSSNNTHV